MQNPPTSTSNRNLKIVLTGLDNAGKSSMLVVLKKMYQFSQELQELKPTVRIEYYKRDFLNYVLHFWDFGGQRAYRERYLERKIYFDSVNQLIYLIDITNSHRFSESLEYLKNILTILKEVDYDKNREVFICFSKMDINAAFSESPEYIVNLAKLRKEILTQFPEFKFDFFSTSIYNIYSIIRMISKGLRRNISSYDKIIKRLEDFGMLYGLNQITLFDHSGLVIGEYLNPDKKFDPNSLDKIISQNLAFFRLIEDKKMNDFRTSSKNEQNFMNYGYKFTVNGFSEIPKATPESELKWLNDFFISIIVDKDHDSSETWDISSLINDLSENISILKQ